MEDLSYLNTPYAKRKEQEVYDRDVRTTKISFNRNYNEYRVRLFIGGKYQAGADYFTDDRRDAEDTAKQMELKGCVSDKTTDFAISEQEDYELERRENNE